MAGAPCRTELGFILELYILLAHRKYKVKAVEFMILEQCGKSFAVKL